MDGTFRLALPNEHCPSWIRCGLWNCPSSFAHEDSDFQNAAELPGLDVQPEIDNHKGLFLCTSYTFRKRL